MVLYATYASGTASMFTAYLKPSFDPDTANFNVHTEFLTLFMFLSLVGGSTISTVFFSLYPDSSMAFASLIPDSWFWYFYPFHVAFHMQVNNFTYLIMYLT